MSKLLATTTIAGALALAAFCLPATAAPSSPDKGASNGTGNRRDEDVSARTRRRTVRRYRAVRVYPAPTHYYGYYGPRYYERPYSGPPRCFSVSAAIGNRQKYKRPQRGCDLFCIGDTPQGGLAKA